MTAAQRSKLERLLAGSHWSVDESMSRWEAAGLIHALLIEKSWEKKPAKPQKRRGKPKSSRQRVAGGKAAALLVACPECGSVAGEKCRTRTRVISPHAARYRAASRSR